MNGPSAGMWPMPSTESTWCLATQWRNDVDSVLLILKLPLCGSIDGSSLSSGPGGGGCAARGLFVLEGAAHPDRGLAAPLGARVVGGGLDDAFQGGQRGGAPV